MTDHHEERDRALADAVRLVVRDNETTRVPRRIETSVMHAWDVQHDRRARTRTVNLRWAAPLAVAAGIVIAAVLWVTPSADPDRVAREAGRQAASFEAAEAYSLEFLPVDVFLQEEPASLQLVRMSVLPSVLTAFGYVPADPIDTQPLDVDVLIGLDGVPRAIHRVGSVSVRNSQ